MCGRTSLLLLFSIFSTLIHLVLTKDVYGYDCSFTKNHNKYIEIDLTETRSCSNTEPKFKEQKLNIKAQVIIKKQIIEIDVTRCKVHISLETIRCGMKGAYSMLQNEENVVHQEPTLLSRNACEDAFLYNRITLQNNMGEYGTASPNPISFSIPEKITRGSIYLAGDTDPAINWCTGAKFKLRGSYYDNHLLRMTYKVELMNDKAKYIVNTGKLWLPDNLITKRISKGYTRDRLKGVYIYNINKDDMQNLYERVNEGQGDLYQQDNSSSIFIFRNLNTEKNTLALLLKEDTEICIKQKCYKSYHTFIPDLFLITLNNNNENFAKLQQSEFDEIKQYAELRTQFGSAFILQHIKLDTGFQKVARMFCRISEELMNLDPGKTALSFLTRNKKVNNIVKAGSVLYATECIKTTFTLDTNMTKCYADVPVISKDGTKGFLSSATNIFKLYSSLQVCSNTFPNKYKLEDMEGVLTWYCFSPHITNDARCKPPPINKEYNNHVDLFHFDIKILDTTLYPPDQMEKIHSKFEQDSYEPFDGYIPSRYFPYYPDSDRNNYDRNDNFFRVNKPGLNMIIPSYYTIIRDLITENFIKIIYIANTCYNFIMIVKNRRTYGDIISLLIAVIKTGLLLNPA